MEPVAPERRTAEPLTAVVAQRVRTLRERSGMSQAELAQRMTASGTPWNRAAVINLERRATDSQDNKRRRATAAGRDSISVGEWLSLAQALQVPPPCLLADPRSPNQVPIADGVTLHPWSLLLWVSGYQWLDDPTHALSAEGSQAAEQLRLVQEVAREIANYRRFQSLVMADEQRADLEPGFLSSIRLAVARLAVLRVPLPPIPPDITQRAHELGVTLPSEDI